MNENELKQRTKNFALRVIKLVNALPNNMAGRAIGNQLIRGHQSRQTTEPLVVGVQRQSLSPNWELLEKKRMKVACGWN
jgi:hypothetical protein